MKCFFRAGDGTQTRDPQLGRLMLYQLSYSRNLFTTRHFQLHPTDYSRDKLQISKL